MYNCAFCFVLFVTVLNSVKVQTANLPPFVTPCDFNDPAINVCIKDQIEKAIPQFTKGLPEFGVPSIDPVNLNDINIDGKGLKLVFTNAQMHGVRTSKLNKLTVDIKNQVDDFQLGFKVDLSLTAKYKIDGRILILPIQGQGDAIVNATNCDVLITSKLNHVTTDGKTYFKLAAPNYKYTIEKTVFDLKNLFNGNKQLAETTLQFANKNWEQLMDDLAPPAIKQIVKTCVKAINKFFSVFPIEQLIKNFHE